MKVITSITAFNDAVGTRISASFSEIDDQTGEIISDNNRIDRVVTDTTARTHINAIMAYAQSFIDKL